MQKTSVPLSNEIMEDIKDLPNQGLVQAVIEGRRLGDIYSNDPARYVVIKTAGPYTFLAGQIKPEEVSKICTFLSTLGTIKLVCKELYHHLFVKAGWMICPRIELFTSQGILNLNEPKLKEGWEAQEITSVELFAQCAWYSVICERYGSAEHFLKRGGWLIGVCKGGEVLGEAYGLIGGNMCELGIATKPEYKGEGISTITTKHLIKKSREQGLIPVWSCDQQNVESLITALKVGCYINRYYAFLVNNI
jgi:hypothetical protein